LKHGKFLCKKSNVLHLTHQPEKAQKALSQAKEIAEELKVKEGSELSKSIAKQ